MDIDGDGGRPEFGLRGDTSGHTLRQPSGAIGCGHAVVPRWRPTEARQVARRSSMAIKDRTTH